MMEKKAYKTVIIGIIIYVLLMTVIFLPIYLKNRREKLYILSGDFIKIKYEKGSWKNITKSDDYKLKDFEVYEANNYKGKYRILFTNRFYLYDSNGQSVPYENKLFAYSGTLKLGITDITSTEMSENDKSIIQRALAKDNITSFNQLNLFQKVSVDTDKDGVVENVYAASNFYTDEELDKVFSIVFIEKNNTITVLKKNIISSEKIYDEPSYEINKVIDVRDDKKYEIMIEQSYYSRPEDSCILLYKLYGNKKLIKNLCD